MGFQPLPPSSPSTLSTKAGFNFSAIQGAKSLSCFSCASLSKQLCMSFLPSQQVCDNHSILTPLLSPILTNPLAPTVVSPLLSVQSQLGWEVWVTVSLLWSIITVPQPTDDLS